MHRDHVGGFYPTWQDEEDLDVVNDQTALQQKQSATQSQPPKVEQRKSEPIDLDEKAPPGMKRPLP